MKAEELMVGNYITFKDCQNEKNPIVLKIWQINEEGQALVSIDFDVTLDEIEIDDETAGIPLTDEILEKNGFVFVDGYGCMRWMDEEGSRNGGMEVLWSQLTHVLQIRAEGVCLDFFGCYCFHELQNIFTVMKIGKDIKP